MKLRVHHFPRTFGVGPCQQRPFIAPSRLFFLTKSLALHKVRSIASRFVFSYRCQSMKNVYEVLRQKELELSRLEKEVEALRVAAPLLSDDKEAGSDATTAKPTLATATTAPQQPIRIPQPQVAAVQPTARAAGWEDSAKRWP